MYVHNCTCVFSRGSTAVLREGVSLRAMVTQPNTILYEYRNNIIIVDEPVSNNISSTLVRKLIGQVHMLHCVCSI